MSSLITQNSLAAIPGILTASLSNLGSVVTSLSALQAINPALFQNFSSQISSLMQGFDAAANITNAIGGLAQSAQLLASTPFSPSNILGFAQNLTNIASQIDYLASGAYGSGFVPVDAYRPSVQQAAEANKQASSAYLYFPENLGKYWFAMKFQKFQIQTKIGNSLGGYKPITTLDAGAIMLPLPISINDQNLVQFSDFNPGSEVASGIAATATGLLGTVLNATFASKFGVAGATSALNDAGGQLAGATVGALSFGTKLTLLENGIAVNPLSTLLLQGPALKEHSLTWRFSPDTEGDSARLNQIIRNIKYNMSPSITGGGFFLNYPSMVRCLFFNHDKLFEFKTGVVTGFSVNYSPSGNPSFYKSASKTGGHPTEIEMTIRIKELEAWLRDDYGSLGASNAGIVGAGRFGGIF